MFKKKVVKQPEYLYFKPTPKITAYEVAKLFTVMSLALKVRKDQIDYIIPKELKKYFKER